MTLAHEVAKGIEIAQRFGHLLFIDDQVLYMPPVVDKGLSGGAAGLGEFIFMVGEDVVDSPHMDVKVVSQIFHTHCGTFQVPPRPAVPKLKTPRRFSLSLTFPENEIPYVLFVVFVAVHAVPGL